MDDRYDSYCAVDPLSYKAERVAGIVWDYCVAHGLSFKFLRGRRAERRGMAAPTRRALTRPDANR